MYTQCPDCSTAFRVTAEVLKQAAGKVRCGGCGIAFNALEYLSEQMPEQQAAKEVEAPLPELTPEPLQSDGPAPIAISAEQSAALLKTLDELAGSDIRIEDTGVEWRVLDDDEVAADASNVDASAGALDVDELLDESPTPVDQFLTKTPNDIDASEIFDESANTPGQTAVDELRFDDNTPLPDDFDLDDESSYVPEDPDTSAQTGVSLQTGHPRDLDEAPVEIALGDPDEWADILGEFVEPAKPYVPPLDAELSALEEVVPADEVESEPEAAADNDGPLDMDTQFALQAEAMGIDLSGVHAANPEELAEDVHEESDGQEDVAVSPGTEEEYDEAAEAEVEDVTSVSQSADATGAGLEIEDIDDAEETGDVTEPELAEETGDVAELEVADESDELAELELADESDEVARIEDDLDEQPDSSEKSGTEDAELESDAVDDEPPLEFGALENAMAELEEQSDVFDKSFFEDAVDEEAQAGEDENVEYETELDDIAAEDDSDGDDISMSDALEDDEFSMPDALEDDDISMADALEDDDLSLDEEQQVDEPDVGATADTEHDVPPQSEEEQTLNLLIDQELLSMAVEDKDGFASTMALAGKDTAEATPDVNEPTDIEDTGTGFESIIMEGEFVRTALEQEKRKANIAEAAQLAEQAKLAREAETRKAGRGGRRGMAAAAVVLLLVLVVQVLHQSREALATNPAFNDTVGPLYRAIGMPLSPAWDVTGWRFEARRDILDEEADTLTVISRIGNTSDKPLPYPLVTISLTDRFEETIGTKTLDPTDYLTDDLDPGKMVRPGNNFTAVMTIKSPSENATGYKLQACYRQPDAKLRCHIPNFK